MLSSTRALTQYVFKYSFNFPQKRYLTEREKKLRLRRKHAEEIIAWKKKLDDEEIQVREIEKQGKECNRKCVERFLILFVLFCFVFF